MIYRPTTIFGTYNLAAPGANTGIINSVNSERYKPDHDAYLDVTVALTTSGGLIFTATDGATTHKWPLNGLPVALDAATIYTFRIHVMKETQAGTQLEYDFELDTNGVVELLLVRELKYVT